MPSHDQPIGGMTARAISPVGWRSPGWHPVLIHKRRFLGLLLLAWVPFVVYAVRHLPLGELRAGSPSWPSRRERIPQVPRAPAELFVFIHHVWVGAGLIANDKRANALQIYLSKPLTRSSTSPGSSPSLSSFLLLRHLGPGAPAARLCRCVRGQPHLRRGRTSSVPGHHGLLVPAGRPRRRSRSWPSRRLTKSSRFVAMLYAGVIFFTDGVFGVI